MSSTSAGGVEDSRHFIASRYVRPSERSLAASHAVLNHGCPASSRTNCWPTMPVAPRIRPREVCHRTGSAEAHDVGPSLKPSKKHAQNEKTRRPDTGRRVRMSVRVSSDHARTQTTSLQGRLTRFRRRWSASCARSLDESIAHAGKVGHSRGTRFTLLAHADCQLLFAADLSCFRPRRSQWTPLTTGVTARLRGVSAVNDASPGPAARTERSSGRPTAARPGSRCTIPGSEKLDFRDIDARRREDGLRAQHRPGRGCRGSTRPIDAGATWTEQFVNRDPKAFFDAMAFWDADRGIAVSDSVDGQFVILTTGDGGTTWTRVPAAALAAGARRTKASSPPAARTSPSLRAEPRLDRDRRGERVARAALERRRPRRGSVAKTPLAVGTVGRHLLDRLQRRRATASSSAATTRRKPTPSTTRRSPATAARRGRRSRD